MRPNLILVALLFANTAELSAAAELVINVPPETAPATLTAGQTLNLYDGGKIPGSFFAEYQSVVNVFGGETDYFFGVSGADVNIWGGRIGHRMVGYGGLITVYGGDFRFNGQPVSGLDVIGNSTTFRELGFSDKDVIDGVLADGTPFAFYTGTFEDVFNSGSLRLVRTDVPLAAPGVIRVSNQIAPRGLRAGQTLILAPGGQVPAYFNAEPGSVAIINGGSVDIGFEAVDAIVVINEGSVVRSLTALNNAMVTMNGGDAGFLVGRNSVLTINGGKVRGFAADPGGTVIINGGEIPPENVTLHASAFYNSRVIVNGGGLGDIFFANPGASATINGGRTGNHFDSEENATITINGGEVGNDFLANGSLVTIRGGRVGDHFQANRNARVNIFGGFMGTGFTANDGSSIMFYGHDFAVRGDPLAPLTPGIPFEILARDVILSGTLSDGTPISFAPGHSGAYSDAKISSQARLFVVLVPEYNTQILVLMAMALPHRRLRESRWTRFASPST